MKFKLKMFGQCYLQPTELHNVYLSLGMKPWFEETWNMLWNTENGSTFLRQSRNRTSFWGVEQYLCTVCFRNACQLLFFSFHEDYSVVKISAICSYIDESFTYWYILLKGLLKPTGTRSYPVKFLLFVSLYPSPPFQRWATWSRSETLKYSWKISAEICTVNIWHTFLKCFSEISALPVILGCGSGSHQGHDSCWVSQTKVSLPQYTKISSPLCGLLSER